MRGMTRLAIGVALAVALSLALFLTLLVLLLADLFCTLRHRRLQTSASDSTAESPPTPPPLRPSSFPFYAHGVLCAPTSLLLTIPKLEPPPVPPSALSSPCPHRVSSASIGSSTDHFISISNPIFDGSRFATCIGDGDNTPFETPETSPSHLGYSKEEEGAESDYSPALRLMKKLPPLFSKARSALDTSVSATETNRASSSSSGSPSSSPSW